MVGWDGSTRTVWCDHEFAGRLTNRILDIARKAEGEGMDGLADALHHVRRTFDEAFLATDEKVTFEFDEGEYEFVADLVRMTAFAGIHEYEARRRKELGL